MIFISLPYSEILNGLVSLPNFELNEKFRWQLERLLQTEYFTQLFIILEQFRPHRKIAIHDYVQRNFETVIGKVALKICRIEDIETGKIHRVLPSFACPNSVAENTDTNFLGDWQDIYDWLKRKNIELRSVYSYPVQDQSNDLSQWIKIECYRYKCRLIIVISKPLFIDEEINHVQLL